MTENDISRQTVDFLEFSDDRTKGWRRRLRPLDATDRVGQAVDVVPGVVQRQRRADG